MSSTIHDEARGTMLEEPPFEELLRRLAGYHDESGVLSVYLDVDPATAGREGYEAALIEALKPLASRVQDPQLRARLEHEIAGVTDEVRSWPAAPGRAVGMFFCSEGGLRTVVPLRFPMRTMARFEPQPALAPLIASLDEHRRYAVVMFDKAQARVVTVFMGAVEEEITLHADVIGRSDVGGWGGYLQARYARHREHHLAEHARRTVEHLWAIDKSRPLHSIVLAGPDEGLAVLRRALPKALANCVVADVALEMWVPAADVVKRIEEIDAQAREREDRELVARVADEASAPGSYATVGWDDALQALAQGRVHRLVLPRGARIAGVECREGHFLAVSPASACPLCGARPEPVEDVVEPAIRMAMHTDALVHFVAPGATEALAKHGAAALLRY